jgi:hypothetical protein
VSSPATSDHGIGPEWAAYGVWNQALTEHFYPETQRVSPIYLDMEESVVREIGEALQVDGDAIDHFVRVVGSTCQTAGNSFFEAHELAARDWLRRRTIEPPPTIALTGLFSLAAERMSRDQQFRQTNYYARLAELLGITPANDKAAFEALRRDFRKRSHVIWHVLNEWLMKCGGTRGIPTAFAHDWRTHVGVPISQALLREADRQELLVAFDDMRLAPGKTIAQADMARLLKEWSSRVSGTSSLHRLIKSDEARETVADVACQLLESWDGVGQAQEDATRGPLRLLLSASFRTFLGRAIEISVLIREPARPIESGLATWRVHEGGEGEHSSGTVEFCLTEQLPGAVRLLQPVSAFSLTSFMQSHVETLLTGDHRCVREPRRLVVLSRDEDSGYFIETTRVTLGVPLVLLVHESLVDDVFEALLGTTSRSIESFSSDQLPGLPAGWECLCEFELIGIPNVGDKLRDLHALEPFEWTTLEVRGGLRIPSESAWLNRAAPSAHAVVEHHGEVRLVLRDESSSSDDEETLAVFSGSTVCRVSKGSPDERASGDFRISLVDSASTKNRSLASRRFSLRSSDDVRSVGTSEISDLSHTVGLPNWAMTATCADVSPPSVFVRGAFISSDELPADRVVSSRSFVSAHDHASGDFDCLPMTSQSWDDEFPLITDTVEAPESAAPPCFLGGAHHWQLPDAGPEAMLGRRPYGIPERCKSCGLEHIRPTRPTRAKKRAPVASKRSVPTSVVDRQVEPISIDADMALALDANHVFAALTYLRSGTRAEFDFLARQVRSDAWFTTELARDLSALGFIDVRYDGRSAKIDRWSVAPLSLYAIHDGWLVCGLRSDQQIADLKTAVVELGGVITVEQLEGATAIDRIHLGGIELDAIELVCEEVSNDHNGPVHAVRDAALGISRRLPGLNEVALALEYKCERGLEGEKFEPSTNSWVDTSEPGAGDLLRVGRYEKTFLFVNGVRPEGADVAVVDMRLGKWLCATKAAVGLGFYDDSCGQLLVRVGCRLPGLYERAVVLPSGRLPDLVRADGQVFHRYCGVPTSIGRTVVETFCGSLSRGVI